MNACMYIGCNMGAFIRFVAYLLYRRYI